MKITKVVSLIGLVSLSAVVWAEGQDASTPHESMPAMMQPMHAQMQQSMRVHMQQIVNAKTQAQRQKLANQFMGSMSAQCAARMGAGAGMMGAGTPMMNSGTPMNTKPTPATSDDPAHLQHHPTDASQ